MAPARAARAPDGKARLRLWLRLLKASRIVQGELRERLRREFATTLPRFERHGRAEPEPEGLTMSRLSRRLRVSNGNVTGIVRRLEADGPADARGGARRPAGGDRAADRSRARGVRPPRRRA